MEEIKNIVKDKNILIEQYIKATLEKNKVINLTAIRTEEKFYEANILDSLAIVDFEEYKKAEKIVDLGTGAGLPGIPLSICSNEKKFTLVDSVKKKTDFLVEIKNNLGLNNISVVNERIEIFAKEKNFADNFDLAVSRALANYLTLLELSISLLKLNGYLLSYKTNKEFLETREKIIKLEKILGFSFIRNVKVEGSNDKIISVFKRNKIVKGFPREFRLIKNKPLV